MTIGTNKLKIILVIIFRVTVYMINFNGNFSCDRVYLIPATQNAAISIFINKKSVEVF